MNSDVDTIDQSAHEESGRGVPWPPSYRGHSRLRRNLRALSSRRYPMWRKAEPVPLGSLCRCRPRVISRKDRDRVQVGKAFSSWSHGNRGWRLLLERSRGLATELCSTIGVVSVNRRITDDFSNKVVLWAFKSICRLGLGH
jgi:hypothetical protein